MKKVLFIDRDGTIIREPSDMQVDSLEKLCFLPGAITALARIAAETDFEFVMVTNQDGLGTKSFPEETFRPAHDKMLEILSGEGVSFSGVFIDTSMPSDCSPSRKPGTAMLTKYLASGVNLNGSYVIGDRETDLLLSENLGCRAIYLSATHDPRAVLSTTDWKEIYSYLKRLPRKSCIVRTTRETEVRVELNLDGSGCYKVSTGSGFFSHMIEQLAMHSCVDLCLETKGDTSADEHHLIEDTGIVLGEAFAAALGSKKGIERYGFVVPMDDALAQVAIDLGGRPWLEWRAEFRADKIGTMPAEMIFHFFKSFADHSRCNINIKAEGINDHHKAEAIFKAFGRAIKCAIARSDKCAIPSTKGIL